MILAYKVAYIGQSSDLAKEAKNYAHNWRFGAERHNGKGMFVHLRLILQKNGQFILLAIHRAGLAISPSL